MKDTTINASILAGEDSYIRYGYFPVSCKLLDDSIGLLLGIYQDGEKPIALVKRSNGQIDGFRPEHVTIIDSA